MTTRRPHGRLSGERATVTDLHARAMDDILSAPQRIDHPRGRGRRHAVVDRLARQQASVVSRAQLYRLGLTRGEVRAQVRARRWQRIGSHCLAVHNGPLTMDARYWVAVLEGGPRALIDGESSLILAGLEHYDASGSGCLFRVEPGSGIEGRA